MGEPQQAGRGPLARRMEAGADVGSGQRFGDLVGVSQQRWHSGARCDPRGGDLRRHPAAADARSSDLAELHVREVRLSAGAGFVVVVCGDMMTMPGLPRDPSAARIDLADDGTILGLS